MLTARLLAPCPDQRPESSILLHHRRVLERQVRRLPAGIHPIWGNPSRMDPSLAVVTGMNPNLITKHSGTASRNAVRKRLEGWEFIPALPIPQDFLEITQLFSQSAEVNSVKVEFCLGGVVSLFKRASQV